MALEILQHNDAIRYSPFELAQYIYWTGDENGVANVIEEFVKNDMVGLTFFAYYLLECLIFDFSDDKRKRNNIFERNS